MPIFSPISDYVDRIEYRDLTDEEKESFGVTDGEMGILPEVTITPKKPESSSGTGESTQKNNNSNNKSLLYIGLAALVVILLIRRNNERN